MTGGLAVMCQTSGKTSEIAFNIFSVCLIIVFTIIFTLYAIDR